MATRRRRSDSAYVTKPGRHGTLYLFRIRYKDRWDPAFGEDVWRTWAYDSEHAQDRFHEADEDEGWEILSIEKVRER